MRVTEIKVKTFYDVEITFHDFKHIYDEYHRRESLRIMFPIPTFDNTNPDTITIRELRSIFERVWLIKGGIYNVIADVLGFDGWYNAGTYNERKNVHRMTLYMYGDTVDIPL